MQISLYHELCNKVIVFKSRSDKAIDKSFPVHQDLFFGRKPDEKDLEEFSLEITKALESLESLLDIVNQIKEEDEEES